MASQRATVALPSVRPHTAWPMSGTIVWESGSRTVASGTGAARVMPARMAAHDVAASWPSAVTIPMALMNRFTKAPRSCSTAHQGSPQIGHFLGSGGAIPITGPWRTGDGGVFLSLCNIGSNARATPLPSNFTSKEKFTNSAFPLILFDATPSRLPASSPVLMLKFESLTHVGLPSHFTVDAPLAVSDDLAMLGYGIGIGGAGGAGVLHTSGNAVVIPLLLACTTDMKLTLTVTDMVRPENQPMLS